VEARAATVRYSTGLAVEEEQLTDSVSVSKWPTGVMPVGFFWPVEAAAQRMATVVVAKGAGFGPVLGCVMLALKPRRMRRQ
jgi:hypothetical protein